MPSFRLHIALACAERHISMFSSPSLLQFLALISCHFVPGVLAQAAATTSYTPCDDFEAVYLFCESVSPSFDALAPSSQASCLCGSTLGTIAWGPSDFDSLVGECASYEATINPRIASSASALEGYCASYVPAMTTPAMTSSLVCTPHCLRN